MAKKFAITAAGSNMSERLNRGKHFSFTKICFNKNWYKLEGNKEI